MPPVPIVVRNSYLVDPASSHMLVSKIKPCMSQYKLLYGETANGSLNPRFFLLAPKLVTCAKVGSRNEGIWHAFREFGELQRYLTSCKEGILNTFLRFKNRRRTQMRYCLVTMDGGSPGGATP